MKAEHHIFILYLDHKFVWGFLEDHLSSKLECLVMCSIFSSSFTLVRRKHTGNSEQIPECNSINILCVYILHVLVVFVSMAS